ncbi:Peroxisome biosynthesis protein pex1 [Irineochytrium annulatum]|nr:Peroxisome biosynthesis protein pex1 [Irineochytrium annulatum]
MPATRPVVLLSSKVPLAFSQTVAVPTIPRVVDDVAIASSPASVASSRFSVDYSSSPIENSAPIPPLTPLISAAGTPAASLRVSQVVPSDSPPRLLMTDADGVATPNESPSRLPRIPSSSAMSNKSLVAPSALWDSPPRSITGVRKKARFEDGQPEYELLLDKALKLSEGLLASRTDGQAIGRRVGTSVVIEKFKEPAAIALKGTLSIRHDPATFGAKPNVENLAAVVASLEARSTWDSLFDSFDVIERVDSETCLIRATMKKAGILSTARDFILITRAEATTSGWRLTACSVPQSPDAPRSMKPSPNHQRSHLDLLLWKVEPDAAGGQQNLHPAFKLTCLIQMGTRLFSHGIAARVEQGIADSIGACVEYLRDRGFPPTLTVRADGVRLHSEDVDQARRVAEFRWTVDAHEDSLRSAWRPSFDGLSSDEDDDVPTGSESNTSSRSQTSPTRASSVISPLSKVPPRARRGSRSSLASLPARTAPSATLRLDRTQWVGGAGIRVQYALARDAGTRAVAVDERLLDCVADGDGGWVVRARAPMGDVAGVIVLRVERDANLGRGEFVVNGGRRRLVAGEFAAGKVEDSGLKRASMDSRRGSATGSVLNSRRNSGVPAGRAGTPSGRGSMDSTRSFATAGDSHKRKSWGSVAFATGTPLLPSVTLPLHIHRQTESVTKAYNLFNELLTDSDFVDVGTFGDEVDVERKAIPGHPLGVFRLTSILSCKRVDESWDFFTTAGAFFGREKWDPKVETVDWVDQLSPITSLGRVKLKNKGFNQPRDMTLALTRVHGDGIWQTFETSVSDPKLPAEEATHVRAHCEVTGFQFELIDGRRKGEKCVRVTYITQVDPRDWLPTPAATVVTPTIIGALADFARQRGSPPLPVRVDGPVEVTEEAHDRDAGTYSCVYVAAPGIGSARSGRRSSVSSVSSVAISIAGTQGPVVDFRLDHFTWSRGDLVVRIVHADDGDDEDADVAPVTAKAIRDPRYGPSSFVLRVAHPTLARPGIFRLTISQGERWSGLWVNGRGIGGLVPVAREMEEELRLMEAEEDALMEASSPTASELTDPFMADGSRFDTLRPKKSQSDEGGRAQVLLKSYGPVMSVGELSRLTPSSIFATSTGSLSERRSSSASTARASMLSDAETSDTGEDEGPEASTVNDPSEVRGGEVRTTMPSDVTQAPAASAKAPLLFGMIKTSIFIIVDEPGLSLAGGLYITDVGRMAARTTSLLLAFRPLRTCFVNIPPAWLSNLVELKYDIARTVIKVTTLPDDGSEPHSVHLGCSGGTSTPVTASLQDVDRSSGWRGTDPADTALKDVLEIDSQYGQMLGLREGQKELHANYIEEQLLNQIRVVNKDQLIAVWVHGTTLIRLRVSSMTPNEVFVRLENNSEVIVAPKQRRPIKSSSSTADGAKNPGPPSKLYRVIPAEKVSGLASHADTQGFAVYLSERCEGMSDVMKLVKRQPASATSKEPSATTVPLGPGGSQEQLVRPISMFCRVGISSLVPRGHVAVGLAIRKTLEIDAFSRVSNIQGLRGDDKGQIQDVAYALNGGILLSGNHGSGKTLLVDCLILQALLSNLPPSFTASNTVDLSRIVTSTEGYLPADLRLLLERASHNAALRRLAEPSDPPTSSDKLCITQIDLNDAIKDFIPASLRGVRQVDSNIIWADVGGLNNAKAILKETLEWPTKYAAIFASNPLRLRSGLLLYGFPGCGKTLLASAVAKEFGLNFISVKGPEILNKYIGASEKAVRDLFDRAQAAKPCILFFDEFESVAPRRGNDNTGVTDRVVNQMLTAMDGAEGLDGVYVLAATSRPDLIDPALLRPGRLDKSVLCGLPNFDERADILKAVSRNLVVDPEVDLEEVSGRTDGFTGADLQGLMYSANLEVIHDHMGSAIPNLPASDAVENSGAKTDDKNFRILAPVNVKMSREQEGQIASKIKGIFSNQTAGEVKADDLAEPTSVNVTFLHLKKTLIVPQAMSIKMRHLESVLATTKSSLDAKERARFTRIYGEFSGEVMVSDKKFGKKTMMA